MIQHALGAKIEFLDTVTGEWYAALAPHWVEEVTYRLAPRPESVDQHNEDYLQLKNDYLQLKNDYSEQSKNYNKLVTDYIHIATELKTLKAAIERLPI
jgi:tRNA isopentenyl-2-thiomethyl-A-37 hydroxylase MiaE